MGIARRLGLGWESTLNRSSPIADHNRPSLRQKRLRMTNSTIAHQRLANQRIAADPFERPADVVQWLGAVQAQDYAGAKWSLGRRMRAATDEIVEQAFTAGAILRTHVLRPTWHFVTPADIHWLLALTAPRVHALNAPLYRKLEIRSRACSAQHHGLDTRITRRQSAHA